MIREANSQVQEFLVQLATEKCGLLLPADVVEAARPTTSPIHHHFTWEDSLAAEKYRLWEARQLIRVHVQTIPIEGKEIEARVFVSLGSDRLDGGGYRLTAAVIDDEQRRRELLADALAELRTFEKKFASLRELSHVMGPIRRVLHAQGEVELSQSA